MNPLRRLIREIHRRSLWQVLLVYLGASWAVVEAVQGLTEATGLPEWFPPFAVGLLLIGLPVVLATAFVQRGVGFDDAVPEEPAAGARPPAGPADRDGSADGIQALFTWKRAILGGVFAFAVWGVVAAGWLVFGGGSSLANAGAGAVVPEDAEYATSIAVLPFVNMSDDPANEYFSDGISEEILNGLVKTGGLRVASRTSAFSFKGRPDVDLQTIAQRLEVDHILEGSVRKAGDRVRITAQLLDAETDTHLWSDTYERSLEDIFRIQTEISERIVEALQSALGVRVDIPPAGVVQPTDDIDAYELYLQGLYHFNNLSDANDLRDLPLAIDLFERALERDPQFARAWAQLAWAYVQAGLSLPSRYEMPYSKAEQAIDRALAFDPSLAAAHGASGWLSVVRMQWAAGERSLLRAIESEPGNALPYLRYGTLLTDVGRTAAANEVLRRASELDPLNAITAHWLADTYRNLGQLEESRFHSQRSVDLGLASSGMGVYLYHLLRGEDAEAIEALERYEAVWGMDPHYVRPLVEAVRDPAKIPDAIQATERATRENPRFNPTWLYFDLAAPDLVFDGLEQAVESGFLVFVIWRMWEPQLTHLRNHPRFADLADRVGLVDYWNEMGWPDLCRPEGDGFVCD